MSTQTHRNYHYNDEKIKLVAQFNRLCGPVRTRKLGDGDLSEEAQEVSPEQSTGQGQEGQGPGTETEGG